MRKRMWMLVLLLLVTVACLSAYADGGTASGSDAWHGMWNSIGGFFYNALPWNWGNWWGK